MQSSKKGVIFISEVTIDNFGEYIHIKTNYSASAIETCFENEGYCVLTDSENNRQYMITPKSVVLVKTVF